MSTFARPRALVSDDPVVVFDCGEESLNLWLTARAVKNETTGASRTFVSMELGTGVIAGFYSVSASSLSVEVAPGKLRRNMPSPIPVVLIGRLAVDERYSGRGLGASLLQDAVLRCVEAARAVGIRAIVVDALNAGAEDFYRRFGFETMPHSSAGAMYLLVKDAELTIATMD